MPYTDNRGRQWRAGFRSADHDARLLPAPWSRELEDYGPLAAGQHTARLLRDPQGCYYARSLALNSEHLRLTRVFLHTGD